MKQTYVSEWLFHLNKRLLYEMMMMMMVMSASYRLDQQYR